MTRPPLIGLSGRRWPAESIPLFDYTALHGEEVDVHLSEYPKVLEKAGALPVQLTRNTDPVAIVQRLDGLVMTGGADPDPELYGEEPHPELGKVERGRDDWELALIRAALDARLPMLCVCRGAQLARMELKLLFQELLPRLTSVQLAGPVERLRSNFICGMKRLPVQVRWA